jgi:putative membrane protein
VNTLAARWHRFWPPLPVWRRLDIGVLATILYALATTWIVEHADVHSPKWLGDLGIVNAVLLGVLLAFRNKEAYERWWEGRKLWGQLVNDSRNWAMKVKSFAAISTGECLHLGTMLCDFAFALKRHLRQRSARHQPLEIAGRLFHLLHRWQSEKKLTEIERLMLDPHARALMDICGACERIQSSPVPLSYRSLLRHGTILYLLTAPWFMAGEFGYWGIGLIGLIAYFLLGTELTAESIEDPFGHDGDDLELSKYCQTVRNSVAEILQVEIVATEE